MWFELCLRYANEMNEDSSYKVLSVKNSVENFIIHEYIDF